MFDEIEIMCVVCVEVDMDWLFYVVCKGCFYD